MIKRFFFILLFFLSFQSMSVAQLKNNIYDHHTLLSILSTEFKSYFFNLYNVFIVKSDKKNRCQLFLNKYSEIKLRICHNIKSSQDRKHYTIIFSVPDRRPLYLNIIEKEIPRRKIDIKKIYRFDFSELKNHKDINLSLSLYNFNYMLKQTIFKTFMAFNYDSNTIEASINYQNEQRDFKIIRSTNIHCFSCPMKLTLKVIGKKQLKNTWTEIFFRGESFNNVTPSAYYEVQNGMGKLISVIGKNLLKALQDDYSWPNVNVQVNLKK